MKSIIILAITLVTIQNLFANELVFNFEKFKRLPYSEKVEVVKAYQKLSARIDEKNLKTMKYKFSINKQEQLLEDLKLYAALTKQFFMAEAEATPENFDLNKKCAFAGWVADYDAKGLCNLSAVKKEAGKSYISSNCKTGEIQCNPMLFGKNGTKPLCVDAYQPGNRGASYKCMELSAGVKDPVQNMKDIIAGIMADPQNFYRLALVLQRLCLCESDGEKGKNIYRDAIHKSESSSTCVGLIKQLQKLLSQKVTDKPDITWFCAEDAFKSQSNQKTIQNDLSGIKAIVDKLTDEKKYDETLKAVCNIPSSVDLSTTTTASISTTTGSITNPDDECTEGNCPEDDETDVGTGPAITSGSAITSDSAVDIELSLDESTTEVKITTLVCKSFKTPADYKDGVDGCSLKWESITSGTAVSLDEIGGALSYSPTKLETEFIIKATITDGKETKSAEVTIPALSKDDEATSTAAIDLTTPAAIDMGDDTVPPPPGAPQTTILPPTMMFIMPGVQ